jgi:hypothetical protein
VASSADRELELVQAIASELRDTLRRQVAALEALERTLERELANVRDARAWLERVAGEELAR